MTARLPVAHSEDKSNLNLRLETAHVLGHALRGWVKLVAATIGVSASRIYKQTEALEPNYLEHTAATLDRLTREGAGSRVEFVLRWLCDRYGYDISARSASAAIGELGATVADIARKSGAGISEAIEALADKTIEPHEAPELIGHARTNIDGWRRFIALIDAATKPANVRAIRSA